jgi:hypothetical protein
MNRESRDHGNIGEKTDGAIMNRESRDHGNIGHARYRTKRNKAKTQNRHNTKKH